MEGMVFTVALLVVVTSGGYGVYSDSTGDGS